MNKLSKSGITISNAENNVVSEMTVFLSLIGTSDTVLHYFNSGEKPKFDDVLQLALGFSVTGAIGKSGDCG